MSINNTGIYRSLDFGKIGLSLKIQELLQKISVEGVPVISKNTVMSLKISGVVII
jgi:hypothetical protein